MGDFPYIEWLARLYKKVGEFSGSWTDYIKVDICIKLYMLVLIKFAYFF